jgi:16S rRNA (cytosine967-C5)-methyltransferase
VSRAVFAYYRWRSWADQRRPLEAQIAAARALNDRFAPRPANCSDSELCAKALPHWVRDQMEVSPAWIRELQSDPVLWLRARPGQGQRLSKKLGHCHPAGSGPLADALAYAGDQDLFRTPEFHHGEFEVQDLSSQCVGLLCAPKPGETWWDACAGEGGKTLHLSDLMQNSGLIWASECAAWRLARLRRRAARARVFNYRAAVWDGGTRLPTKTRFEGVLLDAPCSGLGTWQRNPHARWTTTLDDVRELASLQLRLLAHAAAAVKPGGRLVYATCTLTRLETVEVVAAFEQQRPEFKPLPMASPLAPGAMAAQHWFWPQTHHGNGMFVAIWQRQE